jgi:hypothetical protein
MKKILSIVLGCALVAIIGATAYATGVRQATGVNQSLRFEAGTSIFGDTIKLDSGETFRNCHFASAPSAGTVTNGAIWPWADEIGTSACEKTEKTNPTPEVVDKRQATGDGKSLRFEQNTPVLGSIIKLDNGKTYTNCYFPMAPTAGSVTTGVIYPWLGETTHVSWCLSQDNNNQSRTQPTTTVTPTPTTQVRPGRPTRTPTPSPEPCSTAASVANLTQTEAKYWTYIGDSRYPVPVNWVFYRPEGAVNVFAPLSGGRLHNYYTFTEDGPQGIKPGTTISTDRASFSTDSKCK